MQLHSVRFQHVFSQYHEEYQQLASNCLSAALSLHIRLELLHTAGREDAGKLGMDEIQVLAAFAKNHMKKCQSVRVSELDASQWGHIRKKAGTKACYAEPISVWLEGLQKTNALLAIRFIQIQSETQSKQTAHR